MKKLCTRIGFVLLSSILMPQAIADQPKVDNLALAGLLIQNHNYEKAETVLEAIKVDDKSIDLARLYTLKGLLKLYTQSYQSAIDAFDKALVNGQQDKVIYIYRAQAFFYLEKYQSVLNELIKSEKLATSSDAIYLLKVMALWKLKQFENSWLALEEAQVAFKESSRLARQKVFLLLDLGLYQQAMLEGESYLQLFKAPAEDYLAISSSFLKSGELEKALKMLEQAALYFPRNEKIRVALAHVYLTRKELNVAADLLADAATKDAKYITDAAEIYRRAGRNHKALNLAAYSSNQKTKLKQRLAIYLQEGLNDNIKAMQDDLYRSGLLKEDEVVYAMAYAYFKTGRFEMAEDYLSQIRKGKTFQKAMELRKVMADCQLSRWKCY